jgi:hypothetical protein
MDKKLENLNPQQEINPKKFKFAATKHLTNFEGLHAMSVKEMDMLHTQFFW